MKQKAAVYCRLSEEDRNKKNAQEDSGSIANQKLMLTAYADAQGWEVYDIYADDDYAGSDRSRPAFQRMLSDAQRGRFNIVLCKSQSRFTRELEMVEKYIHGLFPEWGIRFVSVVDHVDTAVAGSKKARQINGLLNEWYLEDMSESIKAALHTRMRAGYFIGSFAPYGYQKDPEQKGHLLIDEEAAAVVREIFQLYNSGMGRAAIARYLNRQGIPSPDTYGRLKGRKKKSTGKSPNPCWRYETVSHILTNEVYLGHLIQGRTHNPTYKSRHSVPSDPEAWVRTENTHEPIIDRAVWDTTRCLWNTRAKPCYTGERNKYAGILVCANCGYHMGISYNRHKRFYRCIQAKNGREYCQGSCIFESTLDKAVAQEIKNLRSIYLDEGLLSDSQLLYDDTTLQIKALTAQLRRLEEEHRKLLFTLKSLYMDKVQGVVTEEQFMDLSLSLSQEQSENEAKADYLRSVIAVKKQNRLNDEQKRQRIEAICSFEEIDNLFVRSFIERIEVGGSKQNRVIHIYWKF